jgi:phosphonopyruvate decarboxylase
VITPRRLVEALQGHGYTFFAGVPCSFFTSTIRLLEARGGMRYVAAPNEGAALATAAGASLSGRPSVVLLQNSGFGNLLNPLTSLCLVYRIPVLLLISMRGYPDPKADEPQHRILGATLGRLLDTVGVWTTELPDRDDALPVVIDEAARRSRDEQSVVALLVRRGVIENGGETSCAGPGQDHPLARTEALHAIAARVAASDIIVSTTGHISRELFHRHDRVGNFYMQGSMGHAMAIALGVALTKPDRRVFVLDGDGAALMHLGSLSMIGHYAPPNLVHVILDNEAYESTGGQATTSRTTRLEDVAAACGYAHVARCAGGAELAASMAGLGERGPVCLLVKIGRGTGDALPRVTTEYPPEATTRRLSEFLGVA